MPPENSFLSQPALSTSIVQLEEALGLQLLIRHHARGVSLTPAGNTFLAQARSLVAHAEEVASTGRALGESAQGILEVGCFWTLSPFFLPGLLVLARERHPELEIKVSEGPLNELQDLLHNGNIEMALLYDIDLDPALARVPLADVKPHVLLPASHPANRASLFRPCAMNPSSCLTCPIAAITSSDSSASSAFNQEYVIAANLSNWYAGSLRAERVTVFLTCSRLPNRRMTGER